MGCDIHAVLEVNKSIFGSRWVCAGEMEIERHYDLFAILGNVRNGDEFPFIAEGRLNTPEKCDAADFSRLFLALHHFWSGNLHHASFVTLAELEACLEWECLRDPKNELLRRTIQDLSCTMETIAAAWDQTDPEKIRLCFFFDC